MEWTDQAIVLSSRKYSEDSGIVCLLSKHHGRYKGLVRRITSNTQRGIYQIGNILEATWNARLSEQLGYYKSELLQPVAAYCLQDPLQLTGLSALCALLDISLAERDPHPDVFDQAITLTHQIIQEPIWLPAYIHFEIHLLSEVGFRLDLSQCAATGQTHDLIYVSPKSGRAVSKEPGLPYQHKLLPLPSFLIQEVPLTGITRQDIQNGLALSGYFLNKYIMNTHAILMPSARIRLYEMAMSSHLKTAPLYEH